MKVGIMQPYFFPYIGYWQLINEVDRFVVLDDVDYKKRGWISRNYILINGKESLINLNVKKPERYSLINEIELFDYDSTRLKIMKKIELAYGRAPFFKDAFSVIESINMKDVGSLTEYLVFAIKSICSYIGIETDIIISSDIEKRSELRRQDRIIDICKRLDASQYINPIGGTSLYSDKSFQEEGIELSFLRCDEIHYRQFNDEFVSNLSIIDVMMFNPPDKINEMLKEFKYVNPL